MQQPRLARGYIMEQVEKGWLMNPHQWGLVHDHQDSEGGVLHLHRPPQPDP